MSPLSRPTPDEYAPYYGRYVEAVPPGDILQLLEDQRRETLALLAAVPETRWHHRYAPGKWSVAQVIGHVADTERVFAYRALRFARGDGTPLPGFEQDDYVAAADFDTLPLPALADELDHVRHATVALFRGMSEAALRRRGVASGVEFSVRSIPYIIAGHERHHMGVLRERYL
jgi:uncharacterized damage-inducible protein DinB